MTKLFDEDNNTIWYQVRWKIDNQWHYSPVERRKDTAAYVYQSWCGVVGCLSKTTVPVQLCTVKGGAVSVLESYDA